MRNTCTIVVVMVTRCQFLFVVIGSSIGDMPRKGFLLYLLIYMHCYRQRV